MPEDLEVHGAHTVLSWAVEPGDCVAFHMAMLHGAAGTVALAGRRRVFSARWLGDDAAFATRPWPTSPPFRDLALAEGAPLDDPRFPLVPLRAP